MSKLGAQHVGVVEADSLSCIYIATWFCDSARCEVLVFPSTASAPRVSGTYLGVNNDKACWALCHSNCSFNHTSPCDLVEDGCKKPVFNRSQ